MQCGHFLSYGSTFPLGMLVSGRKRAPNSFPAFWINGKFRVFRINGNIPFIYPESASPSSLAQQTFLLSPPWHWERQQLPAAPPQLSPRCHCCWWHSNSCKPLLDECIGAAAERWHLAGTAGANCLIHPNSSARAALALLRTGLWLRGQRGKDKGVGMDFIKHLSPANPAPF